MATPDGKKPKEEEEEECDMILPCWVFPDCALIVNELCGMLIYHCVVE